MNQIEIQSVESLPEYYSDSTQMKLSAAQLKELGVKCKDRLDELKALRANAKYEEERQKDFDSYYLVPPKRALPYAGYPNLACPLPRIATDTFHANMLFTFGGQTGSFQVLPDFLSKSHMDRAKRSADFMTYVLNYEAGLYDALDRAGLNAGKYENGYLKARYVKKDVWETRTVSKEETVPSDPDPITGEIKPQKVTRKKKERVRKTVFDGAKIESVDPTCVFASPVFTTVREAVDKDYFFEVQNYSRRFLEEMAVEPDGGEAFFKPSQVKLLKDIQRSVLLSRLEQNKQSYDGIQVNHELEKMPIELAEAHFRADIDGDGLAEKVSIIFETGTGIVLRASFAECRIVKLCPRPVDGRWDGESTRKVISTFVTEWEAIHNQRVAKGQWSNLPFFFFKAGGRFNPQMLTLMPGKGYPMDDPTSINFPQPPPPDPSYFQEEKLLMDLVDRILGLGDVIQGVQNGGDASATNTIQSVQRAGIRLATPLNRIGGALEELIGHVWDLYKQCGPEIKQFKVAGVGDGTPIWHEITSNDYATEVGFKLKMATMYDVQQVRDTALLNYKTFITNPIFQSNPAAFYQLTQETMTAVGLKLKLPMPDQAKVKSPFEMMDLIQQGQQVEPILGEDVDEHLAAYKAMMTSEEFDQWSAEHRAALLLLFDKTQVLKETLASANLNQSGVFEGMNGPAMGPQAALTASRNPSDTFNRMRVSETGSSQRQNVKNGQAGANAPQPRQGSY